MGWRLRGWKDRKLKGFPSSFPAFYLRTYNAFTKAAQRRITALRCGFSGGFT
jgi:hypothetical protein